MNTYTIGSGDKNIVWIPGFSDIAPALSYTKMLEELSPYYTVTVIEPFGYELSDVIGTERTIENIVEEIHEAVKQILNDKQYFLMGHSISGLYAMKYVNDYRDEVLGFIGIDTTTPETYEGIEMNILGDNGIENYNVHDLPEVSDEINKQYKLIAKKNHLNKDVVSEDKLFNENALKAKEYKFSKNFPVLFLLANDEIDDLDKIPNSTKTWLELHEDLVRDLDYKKIVVEEGDHLLYLTAYKQLTDEINKFIENIPK